MNITCRVFILGLVVSGITVMLPTTTKADGSSVYESLSEVPIGRVFFSPRQRVYLDKNRSAAVRSNSVTSNAVVGSANEKAAGFIIGDSGLKQVYSDGDFVATVSSAAVTFPGDVRVLRQPQVDEEASDDRD